ncbi:Similar to Serine/threonine-protein phosphatase 6 regulatory ankyrin repeat subunit A; acc. no. Q505D1, partial [Pyronema omphalodes CBS 100304]
MSSDEEAPDQVTVASLYWNVIGSFKLLFDYYKGNASTDIPSTLSDEHGRLRVWAENVGAHRQGPMSLDHRLREASRTKKAIGNMFGDLTEALEEIQGIVIKNPDEVDEDPVLRSDEHPSPQAGSGELPQKPEESLEDPSTRRFDLAMDEINHTINCLYRMSITLQNPTSRDRLARMENINMSHFESFDIEHVKNKHQLSPDHGYLSERLGKANTKRRQILKYHEQHHEKIVGRRLAVIPVTGLGEEAAEQPETNKDGMNRHDYYSESEAPSAMRTTVSTVIEQNFEMELVEVDATNLDNRSEAGLSQTSYASSASGSDSLRVPNPPNDYDGQPFECPYCFCFVSTENRASWVKHVFRDLRPYVCTFKDCQQGSHLFGSRHEWFNHERDTHRREWHCNICDKALPSTEQFRQHLVKKHKLTLSPGDHHIVIDRAERSVETKQNCMLCRQEFLPRRLRSHLGRHMEQIALFILPGSSDDAEDNSEPDSEDDDGNNIESKKPSQPQSKNIGAILPVRPGSIKEVRERVRTGLQPSTLKRIWIGKDVNKYDKKDLTPLHKAIKSSDIKLVNLLLQAGADPNAATKDSYRWRPLHMGVIGGHKGVVESLLRQKDIDIKAVDKNNCNAFLLACKLGQLEIVKLLLDRGDIDIKALDEKDRNALMIACERGYLEIVKLLLDRGDIDIKAVD